MNIVGPYGSGKSELMAWAFQFAWKNLGVPAIFVNLESLLDAIPGDLGPTRLVVAIRQFLDQQLRAICNSLQLIPRPEHLYLAPDLRYGESFLDYFRGLLDDPGLAPEQVCQIIDNERSVLFLDEIEQKYAHLIERVPSDDRAPFREVVQAVDHGSVPYFIVGSYRSLDQVVPRLSS